MKILFTIIAVAAVLFALFIFFFFEVEFDRKLKIPMEKFMPDGFLGKLKQNKDLILSWPMQEVYITSRDGLKLYGRYFHKEDSERLMIMCHGWKSEWYMDFSSLAIWMYGQKCDLLIIDERAAGQSEGRYITFGLKEHKDITDWTKWAEKNQTLPVYLYGTSMGAASVLMASAMASPCVKGIIADSPFTNVYNEFKDFGKRNLHIPEKPFVPVISALGKMVFKEDFRKTHVKDILPHCSVPVLIFHGSKDFFCNAEMSRELKDLNLKNVDVILYEGVQHCANYQAHPEEYTQKIQELWEHSLHL